MVGYLYLSMHFWPQDMSHRLSVFISLRSGLKCTDNISFCLCVCLESDVILISVQCFGPHIL